MTEVNTRIREWYRMDKELEQDEDKDKEREQDKDEEIVQDEDKGLNQYLGERTGIVEVDEILYR